jgi:hypothetical protein
MTVIKVGIVLAIKQQRKNKMTKYISTKTYKQLGPVAYRQWRADSHCNLIHGYAMSFHFEFEADTLDARNWVTDFGGLKPLGLIIRYLWHKMIRRKSCYYI